MAERSLDKLTEALSAPLGDLISSVANGVAQAQKALDAQTLQTFKDIYASSEGLQEELQRIGYQPTWYKIPEVNAEITMTLSVGERETSESFEQLRSGERRSGELKLFAAPVDAHYANRFGYDIQGASTLKFRIVAVPPSPQAEAVRVVPSLVGKPLTEARQLLDRLGIPYAVESVTQGVIATTREDIDVLILNLPQDSNVTASDPEKGEILKQDQLVKLIID